MTPNQSQCHQSKTVLSPIVCTIFRKFENFRILKTYIVLVGVNHTTDNKAQAYQETAFWHDGMNFICKVKCNFRHTWNFMLILYTDC